MLSSGFPGFGQLTIANQYQNQCRQEKHQSGRFRKTKRPCKDSYRHKDAGRNYENSGFICWLHKFGLAVAMLMAHAA